MDVRAAQGCETSAAHGSRIAPQRNLRPSWRAELFASCRPSTAFAEPSAPKRLVCYQAHSCEHNNKSTQKKQTAPETSSAPNLKRRTEQDFSPSCWEKPARSEPGGLLLSHPPAREAAACCQSAAGSLLRSPEQREKAGLYFPGGRQPAKPLPYITPGVPSPGPAAEAG